MTGREEENDEITCTARKKMSVISLGRISLRSRTCRKKSSISCCEGLSFR